MLAIKAGFPRTNPVSANRLVLPILNSPCTCKLRKVCDANYNKECKLACESIKVEIETSS